MRAADRARFAPAKVNLYLHVGPVQANGRHPLDSLVVFAGPEAADRLTVRPAPALSLEVSGPTGEAAGPIADNLAFRAARALQAAAKVDQGAALQLEKTLPVAAGLGGGSADAAAALALLAELWGVHEAADLAAIAATLGGDVPVALAGVAAYMRGEGERIVPCLLRTAVPCVLANPRVSCPTGPVFQRFDARGGGAGFAERPASGYGSLGALFAALAETRNDLTAAAIDLVPAIGETLDLMARLSGARTARMSGSGSTCFALFETEAEARAAAKALSDARPRWWVVATVLGGA